MNQKKEYNPADDPRAVLLLYRLGVVNRFQVWRKAEAAKRPKGFRGGRKLPKHRRAAARCKRLFGVHLRTIERWRAWLAKLGPDVVEDALAGRPLRAWRSLSDNPLESAELKAILDAREAVVLTWQEALDRGRRAGVHGAVVTAGLRLPVGQTALYRWRNRYRRHGRMGLLDGRSRRRLVGTLISE